MSATAHSNAKKILFLRHLSKYQLVQRFPGQQLTLTQRKKQVDELDVENQEFSSDLLAK